MLRAAASRKPHVPNRKSHVKRITEQTNSMAKFNFIATDPSGKEVRSTIEADTQAKAIAAIRAQNLFPTAIGMVDDTKSTNAAPRKAKKGGMEIKLPKFLRPKVKQKDLTMFTRQLATLMAAGMPLLRSLLVLERQATNPTLKDILHDMGESVKSGNSFSESLANFPKTFDNLYVNMVRAGEAGGVTEVVLTRLAEFMEKAQKIKNKVKGAMTYPLVILCAAIIITAVLMLTVIPKFEEIFADLLEGKSLPAITQLVIGASNVVKHYFIFIAAGLVGLWLLLSMLLHTKAGKRASDRFKAYLPVFGTLIRRTAIARLTRTLGTLLSSGVPMLQAIGIVRDTADNIIFYDALQKVHDGVKEGENMSGLMEQTKVFPPMVISMVDVGEETGKIADMLTRISDTYEDEVDNAVSGLTSILEPMVIILLALIVGTIVIAMFLPLVSIISSLNG